MRNGFPSTGLVTLLSCPSARISVVSVGGFGRYALRNLGSLARHGQDEPRPHPFSAAVDGLGHASDSFGPAEGLFDPLSVF